MSLTITCGTRVVISSSLLTSYRENYYRPDVLHTYTVFNGYTYHYCSYLINLCWKSMKITRLIRLLFLYYSSDYGID